MRERERIEVRGQPLATFRPVHRLKARGQGLRFAGFAQRQHLVPAQQCLEGPAKSGPKLNLAGDGPLRDLAHEAGVQNQSIGNFHWLTHASRVAKCYYLSMLVGRTRKVTSVLSRRQLEEITFTA